MHLIKDGKNVCGESGMGITMEVALDPNGIHFDCPDCMKIISGGQKHVRPPNEEVDVI